MGPVPVGTDGSDIFRLYFHLRWSRPCGDGWFRFAESS